MGRTVDNLNPDYGNLNGGNTGYDVILIKNVGISLRSLSSGYAINSIEIGKLCSETKSLYLI